MQKQLAASQGLTNKRISRCIRCSRMWKWKASHTDSRLASCIQATFGKFQRLCNARCRKHSDAQSRVQFRLAKTQKVYSRERTLFLLIASWINALQLFALVCRTVPRKSQECLLLVLDDVIAPYRRFSINELERFSAISSFDFDSAYATFDLSMK